MSMDLNGYFIISVWTSMVVLLFQYGPQWLFYYSSMDLNGYILLFQYGPQ